ncbi:MAG: leucine-rich repeat domain-containing protein [Clostridia bacterium]|nr:leucine-rich repeat domain-containing protein [Clostridia bacterium]
MNKKAIIAVLSALVLTVVASVTLILTVGQKASADSGDIAVMEGEQYFNITTSVIDYDSDWITEEGWNFINNHDKVKIVIPEGVVVLDGYEYDGGKTNVFNNNRSDKIVSIVLPSTLIRIGVAALSNLENVSSIEIPEGVTSIRRFAFSGCGITTLNLPSTLTSIDNGAFEDCHNLTTVFIPKSVTEMEGNVFCRGDFGDYSMWPEITYYLDSLSTIYCEAESKPAGWDNDWLVVYTEPYDYIRTHEQETVDDVEVVWGYKPQGTNQEENPNDEENNQQSENENNTQSENESDDVSEVGNTVTQNNNGNEVRAAAAAGIGSGVTGVALGSVLGVVLRRRRK